MLSAGIPRFRTLEPYVPKGASTAESAAFLSDLHTLFAAELERRSITWNDEVDPGSVAIDHGSQ